MGGRDFREGRSPLLPALPLPWLGERGQGDRLPNNPLTVAQDIVTLQITNSGGL